MIPGYRSLNSYRVLVYHNITPDYFFPMGSELRRLANSGRHQLAQWAKDRHFIGAIANSAFNAEELVYWGYAPVAPIGLLVDLDRIRSHAWNPQLATDIQGARNLLFVGRMCKHKGQLGLVRMMGHLAAIMEWPVRLLLAGATVSDDYEADVRKAIIRLGLEKNVEILGKRENRDIYALYRSADLYVSLSQHEGFGMPLVEAMAFDLPVLAFAAGSIAATLGPGGLALENPTPGTMAAAAKLILQEPGLRRQMIEGQHTALARYERPVLAGAFERFLRQIGFDVTLGSAPQPVPVVRPQWLVEGPFDRLLQPGDRQSRTGPRPGPDG